jgi:hypothetical protein
LVLIFIIHYLYRNSGRRTIGAALTALMLGTTGTAQIRDRTQHSAPTGDNQTQINAKKSKRGPRALAVVEFLPGGAARLVPIALWIDDRFYDASLYGSNPEPMAIQPETVYEVTDYGEPTGLFTVLTPKEINGSWLADGRWKPQYAFDQKLAEQAAKQPKPKPVSNPDDDRPTLRRSGSSGSSSGNSSGSGNSGTSGGASNSTAPSSSPSSTNSNSSANSTPPKSVDDPDRPTLKKPAQDAATAAKPSLGAGSSPSSTTAPAAKTSASDENDPDRPLLRRGPQPVASASSMPAAAGSKAGANMEDAQSKLVTTMAKLGRRSFPAVSDAGRYETRSLLYAMNAEERTQRSAQMCDLALAEIRTFISKRNTPALAKTAAITDYDLRAFDLDFSNSPTLVLTAKLPVPTAKALRGGEFDYFITVVAREDINGNPIKIFSSVTDSNHLDAFSRMEIIDAVDADANGRGDLLFRQYSDTGINYGLYRVFPYQMQKVFEGGSGI